MYRNEKPKISVIMPVYNGEKYLQKAIQSILLQSYPYFEFIIINDGSTDKSRNIIESINDTRIIRIHQENKGVPTALNVGIQKANSDFIARMDADDFSLPNRFELQLKFLLSHYDYVAVGTNAIVVSEDGTKLFYTNQPQTWEEIKSHLPTTPFFHSSVMMRKKHVEMCQCYDENLFIAQDYLLFNRLAKYGKLANLSDALIEYRLSPSSLTNRSRKTNRILNELLKEAIEHDSINKSKIILLNNSVKAKSKKWKMSQYYLRLGTIYLYKIPIKSKAVFYFYKSIICQPCNLTSWGFLILSIQPTILINIWKKIRNI